MNSIRKLMFMACVIFVTFFLLINLSYGQQVEAEKAPGVDNTRSVSSTEANMPAPEKKDLDRNYWITLSYSDDNIQKVFTFVVSKRTFRIEYTSPGTLNSISFYGHVYKVGENMFAINLDFSSRKPVLSDNRSVYVDKKFETYANYKLDEELTILNAGEKDLKIKVMISKNPPRSH